MFELSHPFCVIRVELILIKFGHNAETGSFEEEVEVLVVLRL